MKSSDKIAEESLKNWKRHNPFRNLYFQLSLVEKLTDEADKELENYSIGSTIPDWPILYYNLSLNSIVSSLEFFFRDLVLNDYILDSQQKSKYYNKTTGKFISFQRYYEIEKFLRNEFKIDLETKITPLEVEWIQYILMVRHVLTHNGGIVDKKFMDLIGSFSQFKVTGYSIGSWLCADHEKIEVAKTTIQKVARIVEEEVKKMDKPEIEILFGN